jgi:hypothetical protein
MCPQPDLLAPEARNDNINLNIMSELVEVEQDAFLREESTYIAK